MNWTELYIDEAVQADGVSSLEDVPKMSAQALKRRFDYLALQVIERFNALLDLLSDPELTAQLYAYDTDGVQHTLQECITAQYTFAAALQAAGGAAMVGTSVDGINVQDVIDDYRGLAEQTGAEVIGATDSDGELITVQAYLDMLLTTINNAQLGALGLTDGSITANLIDPEYVPAAAQTARHADTAGQYRLFQVPAYYGVTATKFYTDLAFSAVASYGTEFLVDAEKREENGAEYVTKWTCEPDTLLHITFDASAKLSTVEGYDMDEMTIGVCVGGTDDIAKMTIGVCVGGTDDIAKMTVRTNKDVHVHGENYIRVPESGEVSIALECDAITNLDLETKIYIGIGSLKIEKVVTDNG